MVYKVYEHRRLCKLSNGVFDCGNFYVEEMWDKNITDFTNKDKAMVYENSEEAEMQAVLLTVEKFNKIIGANK